jgi:hypothetical protein
MNSAYLRIIFAIGSLILGGYLAGLLGIVLAAPVAGALLSRMLIDAVAGGYWTLRAHAYADVQGRHYAYRDIPISVTEDADGNRWLRVKDIRVILPNLPKDATLGRIEPERTSAASNGADMHIRADALLQWLSKSHASESIRFKVWVTKNVQFPSAAARSGRSFIAHHSQDDTGNGQPSDSRVNE